MRWAWHIALCGRRRLVGNMRERAHLEEVNVDGKIILK
jgi:hypothetical protein